MKKLDANLSTIIQSALTVEVVTEMNNSITAEPLHTARSVTRGSDVPKIRAHKILRNVLQIFPYRFQRVQNLQSGDENQRMGFAFFLLIIHDMKIKPGHCKYYGLISPLPFDWRCKL